MVKGVRGEFTLTVPLDASGIKDFKPDRAVRVIAYDRKGRAYEEVVNFDGKGHGRAVLRFEEAPGGMRVLVGPENASADQMKRLQTIGTEVSSRQWQDRKELTLPAIPISAYYWRWWWCWCHDFKITGRVVCANGSPVPGATVYAYDVDRWWWWWSKDLVDTAVTDINGAFEMDLIVCCGWWPWWWWEQREWLLEPSLVERVSSALRPDPKFRNLPLPSPKPSLELFQQILGERGPGARSGLAQGTAINPAELDGLRARLLPNLPAAPQLGNLQLWPWWPWWPWWDCDLDLIFKVTQNCQGHDSVIVDETIWQAREITPTDCGLTTVSVTLVANDQACCTNPCNDPNDPLWPCPQGDCVLPTRICCDNVGFVGGNLGAPASPVGLLNPYTGGVPDISNDRPYSDTVPIQGNVGDTVDYYEFQYSTVGFGGPWNPLPLAAVGGFCRMYFTPPMGPWAPIPFPVNTISDGGMNHNVIETIAHYDANHGTLLSNWDNGDNLLMGLVTQSVLPNGTYYLQMRAWDRPGYLGNLINPRILPVCESQDPNGWVVTIDNQTTNTAGPTDLDGLPCGAGSVHLCTIQPETAIIKVQILHNDNTTTDLGACGQLAITDTDKLQIDFAAYDPDLFLAYYTLELHYGNGVVCSLLDNSLPDWSLTPSPIPPFWAPAAAQVGPYYGSSVPALSALNQGAVSPFWGGGAMRLVVKAKGINDPMNPCTGGAFPYTCCYLLQLIAHKRTIGCSVPGPTATSCAVGCDHSYWNQYNISESSFTITV